MTCKQQLTKLFAVVVYPLVLLLLVLDLQTSQVWTSLMLMKPLFIVKNIEGIWMQILFSLYLSENLHKIQCF